MAPSRRDNEGKRCGRSQTRHAQHRARTASAKSSAIGAGKISAFQASLAAGIGDMVVYDPLPLQSIYQETATASTPKFDLSPDCDVAAILGTSAEDTASHGVAPAESCSTESRMDARNPQSISDHDTSLVDSLEHSKSANSSSRFQTSSSKSLQPKSLRTDLSKAMNARVVKQELHKTNVRPNEQLTRANAGWKDAGKRVGMLRKELAEAKTSEQKNVKHCKEQAEQWKKACGELRSKEVCRGTNKAMLKRAMKDRAGP